mmetsp:Transcript_8018/g.29348  ORF Transcript_8018/g.29348 Transcript_8018/m.29348 type:complete len:262 (+) Transcript_8018:582-1367(+)
MFHARSLSACSAAAAAAASSSSFSTPCVPARKCSSIAGPTSIDAFNGRTPPGVFALVGVVSVASRRRSRAAAATSGSLHSATANPRCRLLRSRFSIGRAGPNTATVTRTSAPSPSSRPRHFSVSASRIASGSTSVARFPRRILLDGGRAGARSSGSPNPGAAARHPPPLNAFIFVVATPSPSPCGVVFLGRFGSADGNGGGASASASSFATHPPPPPSFAAGRAEFFTRSNRRNPIARAEPRRTARARRRALARGGVRARV